MDVLVLLISLILVAGRGSTSHANSETTMDYWQTLLPRTTMPPAILDLLNHHAGSSNVKSIKNSKNVYAASQAGDDFKKIFVSYASEGNIKDLKNDMILEGKQDSKKVYAEDLKKILAARPRSEENLKEISVSYGSKLEAGVKEIFVSYGSEGGQDSKKASVVDLEKILAARPRNEENLNGFFATYGSKLEEDLKEISVSYGSDGEEDLKNISASYGIKGEEGVKEISVSYGGQEDEAGLNKISASEGEKAGGGHVHVHTHGHRSRRIADVFFFHDMLRPGTVMTPTIPPTSSLPALLPRHVANSIPFSAKRFPDIVAMFAPASLAIAGEMRWTLDTCEHPRPLPGQKAGCATSIESLAELTASLLGTRDVLAFSADMPLEVADTSALRARHNVTAARRLSTSLEVVTCHDLTYPYAVFYCHTSNPTAAYMVTLESQDGAAPAMEALAVCHLDTSQWSPENPFFKLHSVSPGEVAVCHFLSKLSTIWVRAGELGDLRAAE
ncbi:uncharacterized protein [Lolium perenne]|uniref:uncharacterized protein isoform X2 n=1 Tax=Lolium perenne TaxID=4522 RepID=UPI0021F5B946|nr:BURP domain-containing protein 11-like isoform X2 [Lolium perenne]